MLEINVTRFVDFEDCAEFSASQFELGENAGRITWQNALEHVRSSPIVTSEEDIETCRAYFVSTGGWTEEEAEAWTAEEVNALLLQFIAGDIREYEDNFDSYEEYQQAAERGTCGGALYRGDDGEWYYYVGC